MLMLCLELIEEEADKLTFEDIYHSHRKQMFEAAQRFADVRENAEDIVQEALLRIARHIKRVPTADPERQKAYVMAVVRNAAWDANRKESHVRKYIELSRLCIAAGEDPFETVSKSQDYDLLLRAISTLPYLYKEVLLFHHVLNYPINEIAQMINRKPSTVKQQLARGRQLLADSYFSQTEVQEHGR